MSITEKLKDLLSPGQQSYECADCGIGFVGKEVCPSCGESDPVELSG